MNYRKLVFLCLTISHMLVFLFIYTFIRSFEDCKLCYPYGKEARLLRANQERL